VDTLGGNWLDHPFWRSAFNLIDPKDLQAIHDAGIRDVWIDTSRGLDVQTTSEAEAVIEVTSPAATEPQPTVIEQIPLEDELETARETLKLAREATVSMFQEARMGNSIKIAEAAPLVEEISQSVARNPGAMLSLTRLKNKDDYTYLHSVAVCALMIALGRQLNYQGDIQSLGMAGLLHDVGKMAIPEDVLNKPGRLSDNEFRIIQEHPLRGWEMLKTSFDVDEVSLDVCLHHHERVDGRGYPDKLGDADIALAAKMGAVCDVYDAITSDRCYKKGWEPGEALKKMAEWKDGHFDESVFHAFVKTIGIYPTGTLLRLKSGRLAVVIDQSPHNLLTPRIKVFFSCNSHAPIPPKVIDLARSGETIESIEQPETWGLERAQVMAMM
jgi:putative nucleotidyltransferase with HDIG domain